MKNKEQELNGQIGGTLVDKKEQLIQQEEIPHTPFTLVTVLDKGSFIALGNMRLTDYLPTKEHAIDVITEESWDFLLSVIIAIVKTIEDKGLDPEIEIVQVTK